MKRINSADKRRMREWLNEKFKGLCAYCNVHIGLSGTVDHYLPQDLGGTNAKSNLRWCCMACNQLKGNLHPSVWERVRPAARPTPYDTRVSLLQRTAVRARVTLSVSNTKEPHE